MRGQTNYLIGGALSTSARQTVCSGTAPEPITATFSVATCAKNPGGQASIRVEWFQPTSNSNANAFVVNNPDAALSVPTPSPVTVQNNGQPMTFSFQPSISNSPGLRYFYCRVTQVGTNLLSCGQVKGDAVSAVIIVQTTSAPVSAGWLTYPTSVCPNTNVTYAINPAGAASSYTWQFSGTGVTFSNPTNGGTSITANFASGATDFGSISVLAQGCGGSTPISNGNLIGITNPPVITSSPNATPQSTCLNSAFTVNPSVAATGTSLTYQWYYYTPSNPTGVSLGAGSGAQTPTYTPAVNTPGTFYFYCVVTSGSCSSTSNSTGAYVVNGASITTQPVTPARTGGSNTTYPCLSNATPLTVTASGTSLSYQWYSKLSQGNNAFVAIAGATSSTFNSFNTGASAYDYNCVVTSSCGTATSSSVTNIIVTAAEPVFTAQNNAAQMVCQGSPFTALSVTAGNSTFQWYSRIIASNTGGTLINGATLSSYTPPNATAGTLYYYCVATTTGSTCTTTSAVSGAMQVDAPGQTATWTGKANPADGLWSTAANWLCGSVPTQSIDAVIPAGNVVQITGTSAAKNLNVSGSLVFNTSQTLTLSGNLTVNGASTTPSGGYPGAIAFVGGTTPKITLSGAGSKTISGSSVISIHNLDADGAAVTNEATLLDVYGTVNLLNSATFDADGTSGNAVLRLRSTSDTQAAGIGSISNVNQFSGLVTLQRHIGNPILNKFRYVSAPMTGIVLGTDLFEWNAKAAVYRYNETISGALSKGWVRVPTTYNFPAQDKGVGFQSWNTPSLWEARGLINSGPVTFTVTRTVIPGLENTADGWNVLGNPYPSAIEWSQPGTSLPWQATNIGAIAYVADHSGATPVWRSFNYNDINSPRVIPMGQAFWVYATADNPSLTVNESAKTSTSGDYTREASVGYPMLDISISHNGYSDYAHLGLHPKGTGLFDPKLDGPKLEWGGLEISTVSKERRKLVYDFISDIDGDIPLHISAEEAGEYQLSFRARNDAGAWGQLYLIDRLAESSQPIVFGEPISIKVSAAPSTRENRFFLSGRRPDSNKTELVMQVHPNPATDAVNIQVQATTDVPARVIGMTGNTLYDLTLTSVDGMAEGVLDMRGFAAGIYMLEVNVAGARHLKKIIKR